MALSCSGRAAPSPRVPARLSIEWESKLDRAHELVGQIWDVRGARFVRENDLVASAQSAAFVAIGEQHDNPDHHRLEARILEAVVEGGRKPAVVFEMIDVDQQRTVDAALAAHPRDADAVATAIDWAHAGWPPWALYRPVFSVAVDHALPLIGAGVDRKEAHRVAHDGALALAPDLVKRFALDAELDPKTRDGLRAEMRDAHCGLLPESMLDAMTLVQRVRDATMADRLDHEGGERGGVLIAGNGHVRSDRGAPRALARVTSARTLSVALVEVRSEWRDPRAYAAGFDAGALPFDYVWFTPRVSDVDHCAEIQRARAPERGGDK